jgi:hypothetical protein
LWWLIALFAIAGIFVGAFGAVILGCSILGGALSLVGGPGAIGVALACVVEGVALEVFLLPIAAIIGGVIGGLAGAALGFLIVSGICGVSCLASAGNAGTADIIGGTPGQETFPLGQLDCAAATAAFDALEGQLAAAIADRDAQQFIVNSRRQAAIAAATTVSVSVAALAAAPFWNPIAIVVAAVAVAAATVALAIASSAYTSASLKLAELEATVDFLEGAVETARQTMIALCGQAPPDGGDTEDIITNVGVPPVLGGASTD